jgi:predicted patatin/cPLA2 family phospholipase
MAAHRSNSDPCNDNAILVNPWGYSCRVDLCVSGYSGSGAGESMERNGYVPTQILKANRARQLAVFWALAYTACCIGCARHHRACAPNGILSSAALIDLNATESTDHSHDREVLSASLARLKVRQPDEYDAHGKKYSALALSGGGSYGAFSAGLLNGWTATGQRPQLDIVSGVSTGALIATYAFLGPRYDQTLCRFYTTTRTEDIYRERCKPAVLWSDSFVSSEPLERTIEASITLQVLCEVAQAHAEGRRLYIGTTNVDTGRLVIWDMGAIASSGKPDSLELYRKIILASASPPGFFPPVRVDVSVNGRTYTELHVDGGATAQVFFRTSMIQIDPSAFADGRRPLVGSCVYIVVAGKAYPDPKCVESKALTIAGSSLSALTYAQTRNDLIRIYTLTLLTGMDFRVATVPQDWTIAEDSMVFDPAQMRCLYERGYNLAVANGAWAEVPPVLDASQHSMPRGGTQFLMPVEFRPQCNSH